LEIDFMRLVKMRLPSGKEAVGLVEGRSIHPLSLSGGQYQSLSDILEEDDPAGTAHLLVDRGQSYAFNEVTLLAPIDQQEVWAAGVTYRRSKAARMDESQGAARFYDLVYEAPRPELFFKATPHRVADPDTPVRIRQDAAWSVPEPELALVLNSKLSLVGFTIGNDMSSRDIEGENPLYLPQAKVYDRSCALGPGITLLIGMPHPSKIGIRLTIRRAGQVVFDGKTSVDQMARTFDDLIGYLGRDNSFPHGAILLTGTGIVPGDDFTLQMGDVVDIAVDGIGTLSNPVVQG
jgi:2-dehydro-3-deoxy-D-arabinonate dehydratase